MVPQFFGDALLGEDHRLESEHINSIARDDRMKGCSYMPPTSSSSFDVVYPQMLQVQQLANLLEKGSVAESKQ